MMGVRHPVVTVRIRLKTWVPFFAGCTELKHICWFLWTRLIDRHYGAARNRRSPADIWRSRQPLTEYSRGTQLTGRQLCLSAGLQTSSHVWVPLENTMITLRCLLVHESTQTYANMWALKHHVMALWWEHETSQLFYFEDTQKHLFSSYGW